MRGHVTTRALGCFVMSAAGACAALFGFGRAMRGSPASGVLLLLVGAFVPFVFAASAAVSAWDKERVWPVAIVLAWLLGGVAGLAGGILYALGGLGGGML